MLKLRYGFIGTDIDEPSPSDCSRLRIEIICAVAHELHCFYSKLSSARHQMNAQKCCSSRIQAAEVSEQVSEAHDIFREIFTEPLRLQKHLPNHLHQPDVSILNKTLLEDEMYKGVLQPCSNLTCLRVNVMLLQHETIKMCLDGLQASTSFAEIEGWPCLRAWGNTLGAGLAAD